MPKRCSPRRRRKHRRWRSSARAFRSIAATATPPWRRSPAPRSAKRRRARVSRRSRKVVRAPRSPGS
nr:MAG: hypothetical protein DIU78_16235 [Pseudomonadota bacterium]